MISINELLDLFKEDIKFSYRQIIFDEKKELSSSHLKIKSDPEEYTKEMLIEPIFVKFKLQKIKEVHFKGVKDETRKVDYYLKNLKGAKFLAEAKPFNADLYKKGPEGCINQIKWLFRLAKVKENYEFGVATDGVKWIFIDKDGVIVHTFDLREDEKRIEKLLTGKVKVSSEKVEEEISKKFYEWYKALLHGGKYRDHENKLKSISTEACLVENIILVEDRDEREQIAQTLINRLIFIKFLYSKEIIKFDILEYLSKFPEDILNAKLKELFFYVLNTEKQNRIDIDSKFQDIPYLNGSLFISTIAEVKNINYKIKSNILKEVLTFLDSFKFVHTEDVSNQQALDPQILGYIFEKAMTAKDRKGTGAYYTPRFVTKYISSNTIYPYIIDRVNKLLKSKGYRDSELVKSLEEIYILRETTLKEIFFTILQKIRICDNACGSGAFLLSTANAFLEVFLRINNELRLKNSEIALRRLILKNNLFGIDINPNAIEIAKLRLWLWLVTVYNPDKVKPLPNIDFNLRVGNSLIGFVDTAKFRNHKMTLDDYFNHEESLHLWLRKREETITKYREAEGIQTALLKAEIDKIDIKVKNNLDKNLYQEIVKNEKLSVEEFRRIKAPFHWGFEFFDIFNCSKEEERGFDIMIGNPPYGNILTLEEKKAIPSYQTKDANEIAANFIEKTLEIVKKDGYMGLIVANSIAINKSTSSIRTLIRDNMSKSKMALFGTRPAKIFADAEIRVLIFLGQKNCPEKPGIIYTTEAIKFTKEQRNSLLENLIFESTEGITLGREKIGDGQDDVSLPKVGSPISRRILIKLKDGSDRVFYNRINKNGFQEKMEFRKTGGYWLNGLEKMPYKSTKIEELKFETIVERDFCILVINSSLFYLYWSTYSNLRDFPRSLLEKFPFPKTEILEENKEKIMNLKNMVSICLLDCFISDRGRVGEFQTGLCRKIIDLIDDFLGPLYGFTETEIDYIKKYDNHIRK